MDHVDREFYVGLPSFGESPLDSEIRASFWVSTCTEHVESRHRLAAEIISLAERMELSFAFPTCILHVSDSEEAAVSR
ncbi:MAG: hypothetical protein SYC29_02920 [Planctomycetota bacterium]|nr:hypothetical protein [Planctomycetota bacterium]